MGPERKLYQKLRQKVSSISWIRLENNSLHGTPDLLAYNDNGHFFTLELKVTKSNKVKFSPHQISFHVRHPRNTFVLLKTLGPLAIKLYGGKDILELVAKGHEQVKPVACGLEACGSVLENLKNHSPATPVPPASRTL